MSSEEVMATVVAVLGFMLSFLIVSIIIITAVPVQ
jgi:hypothetical protein